jgi:hypothetical protein
LVSFLKKDFLPPEKDKEAIVKVKKVLLVLLMFVCHNPDPQPPDSTKSTAGCPDPIPGIKKLTIVLVKKRVIILFTLKISYSDPDPQPPGSTKLIVRCPDPQPGVKKLPNVVLGKGVLDFKIKGEDMLTTDRNNETWVIVEKIFFNLTVLYRGREPQPPDTAKLTAR